MNTKNLLLGANPAQTQIYLNGAMANRHGLIAGATGTGKTVSLQILAEQFSALGVPVFAADVKGDLAGLAKAGTEHPKIAERIIKVGIENFEFNSSPTLLWDLYGKQGHPVRTTVSEVGPILLAHMLELNETQSGILHIAFTLADREGLLLLDLKDLRSLLTWLGEHRKEISIEYGNVSPASVAAIQRKLLVLQESGGDLFFGEPALNLQHFLKKDFSGRGVINVLDATTLIESPRLYTTFLMWLLSELFEELEEVGDQELPRLIFFFDEAHLLFDRAPAALIERIEQVVRLIRSKGVGVFFVTQHPLDIPDSVLSQLGNRVQHALRAFTPRDKKAVVTAANTFRQNPDIDTREIITQLGVGEALVSTLQSDGTPGIVEQTLMSPPQSRIGPLSEEERKEILTSSPISGIYEAAVDRESAYEILKKREEEMSKQKSDATPSIPSRRQGPVEAFFKSMLRSIGTSVGKQIVRGVLGSMGKGAR